MNCHDQKACTVPTTPVLTKHSKERRFLYFNHLSKEFLEQMIPHLKALMMIYVVKCTFSRHFFGLPDSTARNFEASWSRKELYKSKESPITCHLKAILKLEESLS